MEIRREEETDQASVRDLNEKAFEGETEAELVDALRSTCEQSISLVAEDAGEIVGHALFTPAWIVGDIVVHLGMALGPMSVRPDRQMSGIGTALVNHGLEMLRTDGCPFVLVLGHAHYYPRFGFENARRHGVLCPWPGVPDEAFMILVMDPKLSGSLSGTARYREEFNRFA